MEKGYECSKKLNCCYYHEHNDLVNKICSSCVYRKKITEDSLENSKDFSSEVDKVLSKSTTDSSKKKTSSKFMDKVMSTTSSGFKKIDSFSEYKKDEDRNDSKSSIKKSLIVVAVVILVFISGVLIYLMNLNSDNDNAAYTKTRNTPENTIENDALIADLSEILESDSLENSSQENISPSIEPEETINNPEETIINLALTPVVTSNKYSVSYVVSNSWENSAVVEIVIKNNTSSTVYNWNLTWEFESDQKIKTSVDSPWNTVITQNGKSVSAKGKDYNMYVPPNGTVECGFILNYNISNPKPVYCELNGEICKFK